MVPIARGPADRRVSSVRLYGSYEWSARFNHSRDCFPTRGGVCIHIAVCQSHRRARDIHSTGWKGEMDISAMYVRSLSRGKSPGDLSTALNPAGESRPLSRYILNNNRRGRKHIADFHDTGREFSRIFHGFPAGVKILSSRLGVRAACK